MHKIINILAKIKPKLGEIFITSIHLSQTFSIPTYQPESDIPAPNSATMHQSTKRWDPGIQDPEEGFRKRGRFKPQGKMRQPQGLKRQPQGLKRQPQGVKRQPQGLKSQTQGLMRQPQRKWNSSLTQMKFYWAALEANEAVLINI